MKKSNTHLKNAKKRLKYFFNFIKQKVNKSYLWFNKKIKNHLEIIIASLFLILIILYLVFYLDLFFQNFEFASLNMSWFILRIIMTFLIVVCLFELSNQITIKNKSLNKSKKENFYFIQLVKKLNSNLNIWFFILIFVVLIIAVIGNGLFPIIFEKRLPTPPLPYYTHNYLLGDVPENQSIPKISNITCQSATNKDVYVISDILNCKFSIYKKNSNYYFDKVQFSHAINSSLYFSDTKVIPTFFDKDNVSFSILLNEPEIKIGNNYVNLYIDFKDKFNISSTMYSVQYLVIDAYSQEKFKDRNYQKFAFLYGLFAFSLITGLSIVNNFKKIIKT